MPVKQTSSATVRSFATSKPWSTLSASAAAFAGIFPPIAPEAFANAIAARMVAAARPADSSVAPT
jgi:hypothetical protein